MQPPNDLQARILASLAEAPGLTIRSCAAALGISETTASYQLRALARLGHVDRVRDGRQVRHFLRSGLTTRTGFVLALLRDPRIGPFVRYLVEHDVARLTVNQVAKGAGVTFGFARRNLLRLESVNLVRLERREFRYHIHVSPELRDIVTSAT